jgi:hypothetical protein
MNTIRDKHCQHGGIVAWLSGAVVLVILLLAGYTWLVVNWSYSSGERAGWVQKLSHKGWVCKTWEGELSMVAMPGAAPEKFFFSVWSDVVAEEINRNMGKRVSLHYEEKMGIPTNCFGETRYFVTRITIVDQAPGVPGAPATGAADPGVKSEKQ